MDPNRGAQWAVRVGFWWNSAQAAYLLANLTLKIELITAIPQKKITSASSSPLVTFPRRNSM
jgi:hypothetical protein